MTLLAQGAAGFMLSLHVGAGGLHDLLDLRALLGRGVDAVERAFDVVRAAHHAATTGAPVAVVASQTTLRAGHGGL